MDPLLEYLDANFEKFSEFLYQDVFTFMLTNLWKDVLNILERMLDPKTQAVLTGKALTRAQGNSRSSL